MATTSFRPAPRRCNSVTKTAISLGLLIVQGRSNCPSAHRPTANTLCLPTSMPTVTGRSVLPCVSLSSSTSLTRIAPYALLLMGMTSYNAAKATSRCPSYRLLRHPLLCPAIANFGRAGWQGQETLPQQGLLSCGKPLRPASQRGGDRRDIPCCPPGTRGRLVGDRSRSSSHNAHRLDRSVPRKP